ncbi:MAG: sglT 2 [Bacteroidetes bacterium]|nr:sglT 2 [Bacteroidota bacterium]
MNWGASYLVHDFYRRFLKRDANEKHYVMAGRLATVGLFFVSSGMVFLLESAKDAFDIILQVGAGTGLLYLLRWFWWRINAWCEVVAMVSSFVISLLLLILKQNGYPVSTHIGLIVTVIFTTICWVITAYVGPQTDRATLISFYRKARPFGPGWKQVRADAGIAESDARSSHENIPLSLLGWVAGCTAIWSSLFAVGNFLYGRLPMAFVLLAVMLVSSGILIYVVNRLWDKGEGGPEPSSV